MSKAAASVMMKSYSKISVQDVNGLGRWVVTMSKGLPLRDLNQTTSNDMLTNKG